MTIAASRPLLTKAEVAERLRQVGAVLRVKGESGYRARAYEIAADAVEGLGADLAVLVEANRLREIPGVGASLAATIGDLVRTGTSPTLGRVMEDLPVGLLELARIPGLTWRRMRILHDELDVGGLDDLRRAVESGVLERVKGLGPRVAAQLRQALGVGADELESDGARDASGPAAPRPEPVLLVDALEWAERLTDYLRQRTRARAVAVAGSVRRWVETVGDLNLVAAADDTEPVLTALREHPAVAAVVARKPTSTVVRLFSGLSVTLEVASSARFGTALWRATGSAAHVSRLRARAATRGVDLDRLDAETEEELFAALALPFIPPELREDAGEVERAAGGDAFTDLIEEDDIRGLVHCHTDFSDGRDSVAAMARAAEAMGMQYITFTDHSPTASYAGGVSVEDLARQHQEIAQVQAGCRVQLLRGTESDILPDGGLDYPEHVLASLDIVIASIHQRHKMDAEAMTARLVRAMGHPLFKVWGHGLGRLLLRRPPVACDVERVLDAVAGAPAAVEINGSPYRLDLPVEWLRPARRRGIEFVISTDAHSTAELTNLRFGVMQARRAGLLRSQVLNTLPVDEFKAAVRPRRSD